jgi:tetratricopeptide (TPR) repeat protein
MFLYIYQKDYERAIDAGHEMLNAKITRHGEHSQMTAEGLSNMGRIYYVFGEYEDAIHHFEKSHSIFEDLLGPKHHWTVNQIVFLSLTKLEAGLEAEGNDLFREAVTRISSQNMTYDFYANKNLLDYLGHFEENADSSRLDKIEQIKRLASQIES